MRPSLFIDRDGTLNEEVDHLHRPEEAVLTPGAAQALARVNRLGIPVVVVTNQAGIGKGLFGWEDYEAVMARIRVMLATEGAHIDAAYACPFHEEAQGEYRIPDHPDRKPNPGMLRRAAEAFGLDLSRSWMVGDKPLDLEAGRRAGCRVALVRTGYGAGLACEADVVAENLAEAIAEILQQWP